MQFYKECVYIVLVTVKIITTVLLVLLSFGTAVPDAKAITPELLVEKACHAPAKLFGVPERGYVREGYFADLVLVDPDRRSRASDEDVLYKCQWTPFAGHDFSASIDTTIINGTIAWQDGKLSGQVPGQQLKFTRAR